MQQMMKPPLISAAAQPIFSYKRSREKAWGTLWQTTPSRCWSWLKRLAALLIIMHPRLISLMREQDTRRLTQLLTGRDGGVTPLEG